MKPENRDKPNKCALFRARLGDEPPPVRTEWWPVPRAMQKRVHYHVLNQRR